MVEAVRIARRETESATIGDAMIGLNRHLWHSHSPSAFWPKYLAAEPCYLAETLLGQGQRADGGFDQLIRAANENIPAALSSACCFVDTLSAIQNWCGWLQRPEPNDGKFGRMHVEVQLPPGHVRSVRATMEDQIEIDLEPGKDPARLEVVVVWDLDGRPRRSIASLHGKLFRSSPTPSGTMAIYVFEEGTLLTGFKCSSRSLAIDEVESQAHELTAQIARGETDRVEIKEPPSADLKRWDPEFWKKLTRAITSLANTRGGRLIVGATNLGRIVGISTAIRSEDEDPRAASDRRLSLLLKKELRRQVTDVPDITCEWCSVGTAWLFVVHVAHNPPGTATEHLEDGLLIRRGSNTRVANLEEMKALVRIQALDQANQGPGRGFS